MYSYRLYLEGEEIDLRGNLSIVRQYLGSCLMDRIKERKTTGYLKYKLERNLLLYHNEVQTYSKLANLGVCPKLLHHEVLFECKVSYCCDKDNGEFTLYAYYLEIEHHGVDLVDEFGKASSSSVYLMQRDKPLNKQELVLCFPYPQHVQAQVIDLVERMSKVGVYHQDLHSSNVLIKDGVVKIIDFEFCEFAD